MMKLVYLFLVAVLCSIAAAADIELEDGVMVLDEENFESAIAENPFLLVEFYAPWCGHCKSLAPEYAKAAQKLAENGSAAKLAKVDATENDALAKQFEVKGFPTLKFFRSGKPSDYSGGRTEPDIVSWVEKKSGPAAATISTTEALEEFKEKNDAFVLGSFADAESDAAKAFMTLAGGDDLHVYAITTDSAVQSALAVTEDTVVVIKTFDDLRADMSVASAFDAAAVAEFVIGATTPLVQEFSDATAPKIFGSQIKIHVLFFTEKTADYHASTVSAYTTVAGEFKGKCQMINVPSTESRVVDFFGFKAEDMPSMVVADMGGGAMKKYIYDGEHTPEGISAFLTSYFAGEMKPTLKSEEPSPEDTAEPVVVLKGKSFQELVIDNEKDVLVEFYAPWCGHCKKLAPIWDELAEKVADQENIVIAKMDATANEIDVPGVEVKGFPTLYFFKGNDKANPTPYDKARTLEDLLAFLGENAHNSFNHEEL